MSTNGAPGVQVGRLLAQLTAELGDVTTSGTGGTTEYRRGGQPFAVLQGDRIALRLRPDIAQAALRTQGTSASSRGVEWIQFDPDPGSSQDVDRLRAWLTIGWRSAQRRN